MYNGFIDLEILMHVIYWKYKGYAGDRFHFAQDQLVAVYAPNSRSVGVRMFSWLTQKGFGPGYFNNSGVWQTFRKSVFKTEAERDAALELMSKPFLSNTVIVFKDDVAYFDDLKQIRTYEKRARKERPY